MTEQVSLPNAKKSISFKETVRIRKMLPLNHFSSTEIRSFWYTPDDTLDMKCDIEATLKILDMGLDIAKSNEFCERGIESYTKEGRARRSENKTRALHAVLKAQEAQREQNVSDPEALAKAYRETASASKTMALVVAHDDAQQTISLSNKTKRGGSIDPPRRRRSLTLVVEPAYSPLRN